MWMKSITKITVSKTLNQIKWSLLPFQSAPKVGKEMLRNRGLKLCCIKIKKWKVFQKGLQTRLSKISYCDRVSRLRIWHTVPNRLLHFPSQHHTDHLCLLMVFQPHVLTFNASPLQSHRIYLSPAWSPPWTLLPTSRLWFHICRSYSEHSHDRLPQC